MAIARTKDSGTLQYEIYLNDDESEGVVESYTDSAALIEHGANLGELAGPIFATGNFVGEVLGEPSAELRASLADGPLRIFKPYLSKQGLAGSGEAARALVGSPIRRRPEDERL
jgi:hypothetical protein